MRALLLLTGSLCACAHTVTTVATGPTTRPHPKVIELEPLRIDVVATDHGSETSVYDARELLHEGNDALMQHKFDAAMSSYDRLLADFPESLLVEAAQYNAGLAAEGEQRWDAAADRYRQVIASAPKGSANLLPSYFRLGAVLAETERWADSEKLFVDVLDRDDLSADDRVEALARLGFARVQQKDFSAAEETLRSCLAFAREVEATQHLASSYFVGMAQYYLGEIPRQQFLAIPLRYPEEQMEKDLQSKSELFVLAQQRFLRTVDVKDAYWATAGVYAVAEMYKEFWDAWMAVPIPAGYDEEHTKEYIKQFNEEPTLHKLLEKAMLYHEHNVIMARNGNVTTVWSESSAKEAEVVRDLIARLDRKEYFTPGQNAASQPADSQPAVVGQGGGRSSGSSLYIPSRPNL